MTAKGRHPAKKSPQQAPQGIVAFKAESFTGPLPPPEVLAEYNQAFEGCAERIVALTERQAAHRQSIESKVVESNIRNERVGQILAAILFATGLLTGTFLLYHDKNWSGLTALLASLIVPPGLYIYSDRRKSKDLLAKWRDMLRGRPQR